MKMEIRRIKPDECPICQYKFKMCQCKYGGKSHPERDRQVRVVFDNMYLLNEQQREHIIKLQEFFNTSYTDRAMQEIKEQLILSQEKDENTIYFTEGILARNFDPENPKYPLPEDIVAKVKIE